MAYNEALAGRIRALFTAQPGADIDVEEKRMFGGLTFMVNDQMCCGVLKDDLVVRVPAEEFDTLVQQPYVRPFDFSGRPMVGMVYVASGGLPDEATLQTWVQRGLAYIKAHPKKKGK